jgi:hypothetical protein
MYIFIRFTAVVAIILGVSLMLFGIVGSIYGFFQNDAFTTIVNEWLETNDDMRRVINAGFALLILGAASFILGMIISAFGQLMLLFVDLANHARERNVLLRSLRARPAVFAPQKSHQPEEDDEISNLFD